MITQEKIPELRFKEFDLAWEITRLGKRASFAKGKGISKADIHESGKNPCIRYGELYTHYGTVINEIHSFTNNDISSLVLSEGNEVLIPASGETALDIATASVIKLENVAVGSDLNIIKSDIDGAFLANYLRNKKKTQIARLAQGISVIHLYPSQLKLLEIAIPEDKEQQKIAAFLGAVDAKLDALRRKRELLTEYKRGVMQKLFSQEIRFTQDDGRPFPDWQRKPLSRGLIPDIREIEKPSTNYLALGVRSHMKGTFQKPDSDPNTNVMDKLFVVRAGDLVVNITFAWEGAIAIARPEDDGGLVSHRFPTYRFNNKFLSREFFRYIIQQKRFKPMLGLISPGGAGRNRVMSKNDFLKITWLFPSFEEQVKIADFLNAIDNKITAIDQQIEQMETFKKGLLQQMFV